VQAFVVAVEIAGSRSACWQIHPLRWCLVTETCRGLKPLAGHVPEHHKWTLHVWVEAQDVAVLRRRLDRLPAKRVGQFRVGRKAGVVEVGVGYRNGFSLCVGGIWQASCAGDRGTLRCRSLQLSEVVLERRMHIPWEGQYDVYR
jgi:hypothetical protein